MSDIPVDVIENRPEVFFYFQAFVRQLTIN